MNENTHEKLTDLKLYYPNPSISGNVSENDINVNESTEKYITEEDTSDSGKIVGGTVCNIGDFPYMVSIRSSGRLTHFCGGSILNPRWILSAAHCFDSVRSPSSITAVVGLSTLRREEAQAIKASRIFIHGGYSSSPVRNDIALVALQYSIVMGNRRVGVVSLPPRQYAEDLSRYCNPKSFVVAGWGSTKAYKGAPPPYQSSHNLKCVYVPYITNKKCREFSTAARDLNFICTLYESGGRDACQGDSGGPLSCQGIQFGIVSWGAGCAQQRSPGFYTRVDRYLDFITNTMKSYNPSNPGSPSRCIKVKNFLQLIFTIFSLLIQI